MENNFSSRYKSHKPSLHLLCFFSLMWVLSSCGGGRSDLCGDDYHTESGRCEYNTRSCIVPNGSGVKTWNKDAYNTCSPSSCKAGYYDNQKGRCIKVDIGYISPEGELEQTKCEANTIPNESKDICVCKAGYDDVNVNGKCEKTIAKHYSPAGNNQQIACPEKPQNSSWTGTTGLTSSADCNTRSWRCNAGYDNQENSIQCDLTIAKHYSPAGNNQQIACPEKPQNSSWTGTTGLTSSADCNTRSWRCNAGYDNQENSIQCDPTIAKHYSPAGNNQQIACPEKPQNSSWTGTTGLTSSADCNTRSWRCNAGYDNQENSSRCDATILGYYSLANNNDRIACTGKPDNTVWTGSTTGLDSAQGCSTLTWACAAGYDSTQNSPHCELTEVKYYSPAGDNTRTACPAKPNNSSWTTTTGLTSEADCNTQSWRCNAGYDNQENSDQCETTILGYYSPANSNNRVACTKPNNTVWTGSTEGLDSAQGCLALTWACAAGYDSTQNSPHCELTEVKYYSPASNNTRTACSDTNKPYNASWDTTATGKDSAHQCWVCNKGYSKFQDKSACYKSVSSPIAAGGILTPVSS